MPRGTGEKHKLCFSWAQRLQNPTVQPKCDIFGGSLEVHRLLCHQLLNLQPLLQSPQSSGLDFIVAFATWTYTSRYASKVSCLPLVAFDVSHIAARLSPTTLTDSRKDSRGFKKPHLPMPQQVGSAEGLTDMHTYVGHGGRTHSNWPQESSRQRTSLSAGQIGTLSDLRSTQRPAPR